MKNILFKKLKFLIMLGVSIIFVFPKNTIAVDASHVAKVIYKIGSWQVVEIPGKSKIMYRIATDSINLKDTHLTIDFLDKCKPEPVVMIKKFQAYTQELNDGMLILQYKIPNFLESQEIVHTVMAEGDTYAFFKFEKLSADKIFSAKESSRLGIWVPESGDGKVKRSSNFYFSLEGFKNVFSKAKEMCIANS